MANDFPEVTVNPYQVADFAAEDFMRIEVDSTTDGNYTFFAYTYDVNADLTDPVWMCKRVSTANGSVKFAKAPNGRATRDFRFKASLMATYTY